MDIQIAAWLLSLSLVGTLAVAQRREKERSTIVDDDLVSTQEAAARLGILPTEVRELVLRRKLHFVRAADGRPMIPATLVEALKTRGRGGRVSFARSA